MTKKTKLLLLLLLEGHRRIATPVRRNLRDLVDLLLKRPRKTLLEERLKLARNRRSVLQSCAFCEQRGYCGGWRGWLSLLPLPQQQQMCFMIILYQGVRLRARRSVQRSFSVLVWKRCIVALKVLYVYF